jgi:cytosine/adenosine deaminase-related metal-dependent hydrolase
MTAKRWDDVIYEPHIYAQTAGELGLRAYLSHRYRSAFQYTNDEGETDLIWRDEHGERGFERALRFIDRYHGTYDDRIRTMLFPYTLDTVSEDLLRRTKEEADERDIHVRMHTAQSEFEVQQIEEQHSMTPIDYLNDIGYLDDNVCLTHCLYLDGMGETNSETLERIGESGATVISCPIVYRRRGGVLNSFTRYREHGINMALGTDTFPQNIVEEMRWAALGTKLITEDSAAGSAREMFDAVTLNGAQALSRSDIGRLTEGAKADIAVFDMSGSHVSPFHDPIKALVHYVTPADTVHVFVDGNHLVQNGEILALDETETIEEVRAVHDKMGRVFANWLKEEDPETAFPPAYPVDPFLELSR